VSGPTAYRWLVGGPDQPFPSERLLASDVPPPLTSSHDAEAVQLVNQFAHTFNGYDWAGSLEQLAARYRQVQQSESRLEAELEGPDETATGVAMGNDELLAGLTKPRGNWSPAASWHADDRTLVAVTARGYGAQSLNLLAFGLERLEGRTLHLVVPRTAVNPSRARAAFLDVRVHVHASQSGGAGEAESPLSRAEATAFYRRLGGVTPPQSWESSRWPEWLVDLIDWVESRRVERVRNSEFHAWHYRGRQVLSVRRTAADGYRLTAGVNYRAPTADQPAPVKLHVPVRQALTAEQATAVRSAVDQAIERRRIGEDDRHREHLLQAAIGTDPSLIGTTHLRRELPAWRPKQQPRRGRAFIDFLGRDVDRTGHVIETKIGPDAQLGIQALDYWAWVDAHRADLAEYIDADPGQPFELDLVLGRSTKQLLHPAAAATLEALHEAIAWRCHLVSRWDTVAQSRRLLTPEAEPLPQRQLPD
jgi:hypothetical protein